MKAAILHKSGSTPKYGDIDLLFDLKENQQLLNVKAAAVKNLDKARVSGKHYASYREFPTVAGTDGVGELADGTRVYGFGITGMLAEQAIIGDNYTPIPHTLDYVTAAALPNAVLGSAMPLLIRAKLVAGQTVLFNGATGVTGHVAVQIAKHYGAKNIIVTGRNERLLEELRSYGATHLINLKDTDDSIKERLAVIHRETPIDIVIDYLWGKPISLIMEILKGDSITHISHTTKIVTAGDMAGKEISLSSSILRSSAIEILGSGFGSLSPEELIVFNKVILPEMFLLASNHKLHIQTEAHPLESIEEAWNKQLASGTRLVITI
ncbi:zinc-binding alcohol dehydrogenase family protein [Myroides sp. M-43]|uniref:quinone oxidoreductase family protein n=1 Tax=Myroides oncorhynchi TaxID=2893756 RepID=UPI001E547707|nr:zinc-binding alcohol dehydrogenase family protein [Myroides oncorhynchi]MCC9044081.1 zinc-binding alcohol dehydrogenase family protein [Myroides oncorhynchi]